MDKVVKLLGLSSLLLIGTIVINTAQAALTQRADVSEFITEMANKHNLNKTELEQLFQEVEIRGDIINAMNTPAEGKPWFDYQKILVTDDRVQKGADFWQKNEETLQRAEQEYGVPASIVVAIIGVETNYGETQGKYRVMDALSTLAFEYPKRADFFKKELEQFLLLTRENKLEPLSVLGSYAGAIGQGQFIPSSYRHYAVDYTGDGTADLRGNTSDAIGSVANYLKKNGWQAGQPVVAPIDINGDIKAIDNNQLKPTQPLAQLKQNGVKVEFEQTIPEETLATLISLEGETDPEYWVGFNNFYTITRYNISKLYAMAVYQLAEEISTVRQQPLI